MNAYRDPHATVGSVVKLSTTFDSVRMVVDIPREIAPVDLLSWKDNTVEIRLVLDLHASADAVEAGDAA